MDAMREDMTVAGVTEKDAEDRNKIDMENPLWRPLTGDDERRRKIIMILNSCKKIILPLNSRVTPD